jgi:hypothetical protein
MGRLDIGLNLGKKRTQLGRVMHLPCSSYQEGQERLATIERIRQRQGYQLILNSLELA